MQINNCVSPAHYISYPKSRNTNVGAEFSLNLVDSLNTPVPEESTNAVSMAEYEDEGEFLGITMVPEDGQSVIYGMRAMLSNKSTSANPIVQVISNLEGKQEIYNVDIRKVNPKNATQLEMFALLSYTDKMGLTDGGTFGSHQQLQLYAENASHNGYCGSIAGGVVFCNGKFNWSSILEKIMNDYLNARIYNQYDDCKKLFDSLGTVAQLI